MKSKRAILLSPALGEMVSKFVDDAFASNWMAPLGPMNAVTAEGMRLALEAELIEAPPP